MRLNWWNEGLQLKMRIRPAGLALALLYGLTCWATRQLSLDQFYLPAGVRVAAVLLCPPRLWPYLLLGEYSYFAQMRYPMVDKYGMAWAILASALLMPAVMLITHVCRRLMTSSANARLLMIALLSSIVVTLLNVGFSQLLWPTPPADSAIAFLTRAVRFSVGDFIAILTVAPLALLWARRKAGMSWRTGTFGPTAVALSVMILLGVTAALIPPEAGALRTSLQLLMGLPAIALTCLHGWRGAAIGVPALNLIIGLTTPKPYAAAFDASTFTTQQVMAITGVALLLLGSRISHYHRSYRLREVGEKNAISLARSSHMASESDLRERAIHLRKLGDGIDLSLSEVINWLNTQGHSAIASSLTHTANVHSRLFREQASMVYPAALEQLGLYVALQAGGVRSAWADTHRVADLQLAGDPCQLSLDLQLAAYRTLIDAVSLLLKCEPGQLVVRARCFRKREQRGIVMIVSLLDRHSALSAATSALANDRLAGRTLAFGGSFHCRNNRLIMILMESAATTRRESADDVSMESGHSPAVWDGRQAQA
ncbi:MASE1 domain-containing protein [Stenotrophomonas maltophilia]|uniref:MASE1 domain-containing protein n=1 Tax=Stenotrophomonas maltophilia TaxID=40324 RepID=UPI002893A3AD|nr:MASE1 domain-containing protein [Stenotrophomonas maltophilia]MDT3500913.1 MASE1 domain-containing protein [Stenotrophomonas maltophilia]